MRKTYRCSQCLDVLPRSRTSCTSDWMHSTGLRISLGAARSVREQARRFAAAPALRQPELRSDLRSQEQSTPQFKALLLDAAGTLLSPSEPAAQVYLRYGARFGITRSEAEVLAHFRRAYNTPWVLTPQRYVGDGRPFWNHIVKESTGCGDVELANDVYDYFARPEAWTVTPGAVPALLEMRAAGVRMAVVSNFDTRLRPLMHSLGLDPLFDSLIISAEHGIEKPNPRLFEAACDELGVDPADAVHVGDDRRTDIYGARDAGCYAWLWGVDVHSFKQVAKLVLHGGEISSDDES